ncbi:MAG: hypothetical protein OMM_07433 [Candidatus Magnetoglobus multicellularis str. Araruama]|uniref:Uncharacterized protein n=1 Tax=Candidatus Magnetoglobus multicellularis str. Araruama TaxID=890399 RepID=A0A1V1PD24_9BACT|nr:MAG: hypothetical protein OMM_07433 [Candidatus Magnetoglobus multicellularis str. Araruama]
MQNITHTKQYLLPLLITCLFIYNAIDVTQASGFEMTTQWHIPQKTGVIFDYKKRSLKLRIETQIVLYKPQKKKLLLKRNKGP